MFFEGMHITRRLLCQSSSYDGKLGLLTILMKPCKLRYLRSRARLKYKLSQDVLVLGVCAEMTLLLSYQILLNI